MFNAKEGNAMAKTYIWAHDAGHEWLAVKISELAELGIADKISAYSYQKGTTAYLEGDCDAAVFFEAYRARHGADPKTKQGKYWDVQPLRRFARYSTPVLPKNSLGDYIEQANRWTAIFNPRAGIEFPLTQNSVNQIVDRLNGDLSPENLHCDGEITASQARAKYQFYKTVAAELEAYCKQNALHMREVYEL